MEHEDFCEAMFNTTPPVWTARWGFSKVPTRDVDRLYTQYLALPEGTARLVFRQQHPELDDWVVLAGKVTKPIGKRGLYDVTPTLLPWQKGQTVTPPK